MISQAQNIGNTIGTQLVSAAEMEQHVENIHPIIIKTLINIHQAMLFLDIIGGKVELIMILITQIQILIQVVLLLHKVGVFLFSRYQLMKTTPITQVLQLIQTLLTLATLENLMVLWTFQREKLKPDICSQTEV